jgi:8-hydroxy-5-deazaflavin:NADPH oxidoreductase
VIGHALHYAVIKEILTRAKRRRRLRISATPMDVGTPQRISKGTDSTMKVAIIGSGNVGKALGASISKAGHHVVISASQPDHARSAAEQIGATAADSNADAVAEADVVILAVWYPVAVGEVASEIAGSARGRVVVDVTNPVKPDLSGLATEGTSAAEELQQKLPDARVVKAFNTVFGSNQANPRPDVQVHIAADDADAKRTVQELAESIGMTTIDAGGLAAARYLEGMALLNMQINATQGGDWTSRWVLVR